MKVESGKWKDESDTVIIKLSVFRFHLSTLRLTSAANADEASLSHLASPNIGYTRCKNISKLCFHSLAQYFSFARYCIKKYIFYAVDLDYCIKRGSPVIYR